MEKLEFTQDTMVRVIEEINNAKTLDEIAKIGKELTNYEMDQFGFKTAVSKLYSAKRRQLAETVITENKVLRAVYFGFVAIQKKRKGANGAPVTFTEQEYFDRMYAVFKALEESGMITKEEARVVYDKIEQISGRKANGNGEANGSELSDEPPF